MAQLQFKGKQFVQNHHLSVKFHELIPKKDKSLTGKVSLHDNLILHGDNLKALKSLLPTYAGKIKCIYIDPPYNTGNEKWVYNDNVNSPMMQEWLGKIVDKEDLTRHDKWLCMMTPRLKFLRELLKEDGVIFISIDDNEVHHLRILMDEIFGEENFVECISWEKKSSAKGVPPKNMIVNVHEYILVYQKSEEFSFIGEPRSENGFNNPDNDPRGQWRNTNIKSTVKDKSQAFSIIDPKTGNEFTDTWAFGKSELERLIKEKYLIFPKNKNGQVRKKEFFSEFKNKNIPIKSSWGLFDNQKNTEMLKGFFGDFVFANPKSLDLIVYLLKSITNKNDIILDSFAGSGTTAHAVLALNKEDEGNRKFMLVECEDYADNITAERVRRVIKGVSTAKDENLKNGLGGSFIYFDLGKPIEMESILSGKNLPSYEDLARYVFYTATGEEFNEKMIDKKRNFIGESKDYEVFLFYEPNIEYLKNTALTLNRAENLGKYKNKKRLVFAPTKYLDQDYLDRLRIDFAQLPFEIYKLVK